MKVSHSATASTAKAGASSRNELPEDGGCDELRLADGDRNHETERDESDNQAVSDRVVEPGWTLVFYVGPSNQAQ